MARFKLWKGFHVFSRKKLTKRNILFVIVLIYLCFHVKIYSEGGREVVFVIMQGGRKQIFYGGLQ